MFYGELLNEAAAQIGNGAFLMTGDRPNPMTIGWAQWGYIWGKPICTVLVRQSRYSHKLIEKGGNFTVSLPAPGTFKAELSHCGYISGRDEDKVQALGVSLVAPVVNGIPGIKGCAMHFECKVVFKAESDLSLMDPAIRARFYGDNQATPDGDPHTIYFGEILAAYRE